MRKLALVQHFTYVAPITMMAFLWGSMGILQGIYAKYFGVALSTIAMVLLISRLFDAFTDPLVGYWSDRYHSKAGSRKPFIVVGGLLFIISSYFLYVPIDPSNLNPDTTVSTLYFLGWFLAFYFSWTLVEIPHLTWGADLTHTSKETNKIFSFRASATLLGILLFYLVPLLPIFSSNEFTPHTLQFAVIGAGLLMLPALYFCVTSIPKSAVPDKGQTKQKSLWALRTEIITNKPFMIFMAAFLLYGIAVGMWFTLIFIFVDIFLDIGHHFALLTLIALSLSIASLGFWYWLANRYGRKIAWGFGTFCYGLAMLGTGFLDPGQTGLLGLSIVMLLAYGGSASVGAVSPSLLADIIEYSRWKFKSDHSATYFSLYTLSLKTTFAIGGSIALAVAGGYGFDAGAPVQTHQAVFGLRLVACWLPAVAMFAAIYIMAFVPIDTRRNQIIRRRLDRQLIPHSSESDSSHSAKIIIIESVPKEAQS